MILSLGNVHCRVIHATPEEHVWLKKYLTFEPKDGRPGAFGGEVTLLRTGRLGREAYFPAGLVPLVERDAPVPDDGDDRDPYTVTVRDDRVRPCEPDWSADIGWLVDHQREGVRAAVEKGRGILAHATRAGKGEIMVALTKVLPCRWLICAHRFNLCQDVAKRYADRTGMRAGLIGDGEWSLGDGQLVCATWQSLHSRLEKQDPRVRGLLLQVQGLMGDESHTTAADTFKGVCDSAVNAYWRIGLSGTPIERSDKRSIYCVGAFGPIIHRVTPAELTEIGFAARLIVHMERVVQPARWVSDKYKAYIVDSEERNARVVAAVQRHEKPGLVFVQRIEHGDALKRMIEKVTGVKVSTLFGRVPARVRGDVMRGVTREGHAVLVTNKVTQEGEVDQSLVEFRSMVNAGGMQSSIVVNQQAGRLMGKYDKQRRLVKEEAHAVDFLDQIDGDPHASVANHARSRMKAYTKAGHQVLLEG